MAPSNFGVGLKVRARLISLEFDYPSNDGGSDILGFPMYRNPPHTTGTLVAASGANIATQVAAGTGGGYRQMIPPEACNMQTRKCYWEERIDLVGETTYTYQISAFNSAGESDDIADDVVGLKDPVRVNAFKGIL